jgi:hypothetical protein
MLPGPRCGHLRDPRHPHLGQCSSASRNIFKFTQNSFSIRATDTLKKFCPTMTLRPLTPLIHCA